MDNEIYAIYLPKAEPDKWAGQSPFIPGVPTNSLSEEEWNALPERAQQKAIGSGLFRIVEHSLAPLPDYGKADDDEPVALNKRGK